MKVLYKFSLIIASVFFLYSCEKETEGLSKITHYADFEMAGANFVFVIYNSTFTDPGVKAFESGKELPVTTKGTVDTSVPGIHQIQYSATNSDGLSTSVTRTVAVVNAIPSVDHTGEYQVVGRTNTSTITKNGGVVGYYRASDSWWQTYRIPIDFVDMGDETILVLNGSSMYGPVAGTGVILPGDQIRFSMRITSGINAGVAWTATYQKQ